MMRNSFYKTYFTMYSKRGIGESSNKIPKKPKSPYELQTHYRVINIYFNMITVNALNITWEN